MTDKVNKSFRDGIVAPDQWKDFPYHYGKSNDIRKHLMKARGYFLQDNQSKAFFHLGVALHYIQDSYTSIISYRSPMNQLWHQNWEESIEKSYFSSDLEKTISFSLKNKRSERERCLRIADVLSKDATGRDRTLFIATLSGQYQSKSSTKPIVDLNLGLKASLVVTKSVLSSKTSSTLETKLKDLLSTNEDSMRTTEKKLSNRIIKLVNERDDFAKSKVTQSGIAAKIKNWILGLRIRLKVFSVNSNCKNYRQQKHLESVAKQYEKKAKRTVSSYKGWYNFQIPLINPDVVSKELLSIKETAEILEKKESVFKQSLKEFSIPHYQIENKEFIRRSELDSRFLNQFSLNRHKKLPS